MSRVLITGASGFLGRALVTQARASGTDVVALTRRDVDLGDTGAPEALAPRLEGVTAVIHAAASFAGDAETHARDTIGATEHLVRALTFAGGDIRLVLGSSLSVYDVAALNDHAVLREDSPLVRDAAQRDAYAAAKVAQESIVQAYIGPKQVIRPGAIYGPHRLWSAQLGFARGSVVICPGGDARMPAIEVARAAAAILHSALAGQGADVVNLIDPDPPTQADWIAALGMRPLRVPRAWVLMAAGMLGRGPGWRARFRPLRYDTARAEALLDPDTQRPFADQIATAKAAEAEARP